MHNKNNTETNNDVMVRLNVGKEWSHGLEC